jgi:5-hydroxyisourate hydrolase-like protein (transthyretin family)
MKVIAILFALLLVTSPEHSSALAQSLIVHTVDQQTGKPLSGVPVTIRQNFLEPRRAKKGEVQTAETDAEGKACFQKLSLTKGGFTVFVFSMNYQGIGMQPVFFPPDGASTVKLSNPVFTSLPTEITLQIHRRSFGEKVKLIYPGP